VVVVIMQVANYAERFTTQQARKAVRQLTALAPATARVPRRHRDRDPIDQVRAGEIVSPWRSLATLFEPHLAEIYCDH